MPPADQNHDQETTDTTGPEKALNAWMLACASVLVVCMIAMAAKEVNRPGDFAAVVGLVSFVGAIGGALWYR